MTGTGRRIVDLSHPIEAGMITYPGLPAPEVHAILDRATSAGRYAPGVTFQIDLITLCGNTGTYIDSPFHRYADGVDLAGLPPERLLDLPTVRIDVTGATSRAIDADAFAGHDLGGRAVLVHTGFDRFWRTDAYLHDNPFLTPRRRRAAGRRRRRPRRDRLAEHRLDRRPGTARPLGPPGGGHPDRRAHDEPRRDPARGGEAHRDPGPDPRDRHVPRPRARGRARGRVGNAQGQRRPVPMALVRPRRRLLGSGT